MPGVKPFFVQGAKQRESKRKIWGSKSKKLLKPQTHTDNCRTKFYSIISIQNAFRPYVPPLSVRLEALTSGASVANPCFWPWLKAPLNTHSIASLYETFEPQESRRLAERLDIHYTPKRGSWLNMAEIELSVLKGQCLDRRIPDMTTIHAEVAAWEKDLKVPIKQLAVHNIRCSN